MKIALSEKDEEILVLKSEIERLQNEVVDLKRIVNGSRSGSPLPAQALKEAQNLDKALNPDEEK